MEGFILVDSDDQIIKCVSSDECNLHQDKLDAGMKKYKVLTDSFVPGDRFDSIEEVEIDDPYSKEKLKVNKLNFTSVPENYPQPSGVALNEQKIQNMMRVQAIKGLKINGDLAIAYEDPQVGMVTVEESLDTVKDTS